MKTTVEDAIFEQKRPMAIFARYYRKDKILFAIDMICAFSIAGIDLMFPMVSRYALSNFLPEKQYRAFFIIIAIMAGAFVIRTGMQYVVTYWGHVMGANIEMRMRYDLFSHIQKLSFPFFDRTRTGSLMSRILPELFDITELAHHGPEELLISSVTIIGSTVALFLINVKLAIILAISVPFLIVIAIALRKRLSSASRHLKESTAVINSEIESCISGIRVSMAFGNEQRQVEKFQDKSWLFRSAKARFYRTMAMFHSSMESVLTLLSVVAIAAGGYFIMKGEMNIVDLIAFTLYVSIFAAPIRKIAFFTELYQSGMSGFLRFIEIMKVKPDIVNREGAKAVERLNGEIIFDNVSFSYSAEESADMVLSNVDLDIPAGRTTAIVGPSGGGKTTLCHLIPRFYETRSGSIRIDGTDIRDIDIASLRANIGIVQQDVFLFAESIMENIRFGNPDANDDEVVEAARKAEIHDFIVSLPEGYQTVVGERGVTLSGGQKQRISIARVFLKNPPILILDEATSSLDTVTENKIKGSIERLSKGRTSVIIAHRLSTIKMADQIVYLSEKGVEEKGSHDELMNKKGSYYRLQQMQIE
ncbi:MAG: ABC transporter ATP-binding protein [Clostridiales bacterium]|nr:ABC transporter ATP-binding protein [Clostridiales bacterium]